MEEAPMVIVEAELAKHHPMDSAPVWHADVWIEYSSAKCCRAAIIGHAGESRESVLRRCVARARANRRMERR